MRFGTGLEIGLFSLFIFRNEFFVETNPVFVVCHLQIVWCLFNILEPNSICLPLFLVFFISRIRRLISLENLVIRIGYTLDGVLHFQLNGGFVHLELDELLLLFLFVSSVPVDFRFYWRYFFGLYSRFAVGSVIKNSLTLKSTLLGTKLIFLVFLSPLSRSCFASQFRALYQSNIVNLLKNLLHAQTAHLVSINRIHHSHCAWHPW